MFEDLFYKKMEIGEKLSEQDVTEGWFPTVEEMETHKVAEHLTDDGYLPLAIYFSGDPFKDMETKMDAFTLRSYKDTVKYCKQILLTVPLEERVVRRRKKSDE
jgi:hypothetical protein